MDYADQLEDLLIRMIMKQHPEYWKPEIVVEVKHYMKLNTPWWEILKHFYTVVK